MYYSYILILIAIIQCLRGWDFCPYLVIWGHKGHFLGIFLDQPHFYHVYKDTFVFCKCVTRVYT